MYYVNLHPKALIDEINNFSRQVRLEISDAFRSEIKYDITKKEYDIPIDLNVTCDGFVLSFSKKLTVTPFVTPMVFIEKDIKRVASEIADEMSDKLCRAIICNPKFINQSMYFVDDWEMLI